MTEERQILKIGDFFDAGWKIITALIAIVAFIVQVALAWYKIGDNATDISNLNKKMEVGFINEADKRSTRISTTDAKFDRAEKKQDEILRQIDELQKEVFYLKGLINKK